MARGWESKSVEDQQAEASAQSTKSGAERRTPEEALRWREIEGLRLSRQRIVEQLASTNDPRHRKMLEAALTDLESRMKNAGGEV